jgi:hypothetical protein
MWVGLHVRTEPKTLGILPPAWLNEVPTLGILPPAWLNEVPLNHPFFHPDPTKTKWVVSFATE